MSVPKSRRSRIASRIAFAVVMALFFAVLGIFSGLGYHVYSMKELSFVRHSNLGYADVILDCDILYDPLLFPFYWVAPNVTGRLSGVFHIISYPEGFGGGDFGGPRWPMMPAQRFEGYVTTMSIWGFYPNLVILLFITFIIEIAQLRILYIGIFSGLIGFYAGQLVGMAVGLIVGVVFCLVYRFRLPKDNVLSRFWVSLWE